jgi:hypothetical protein
MTYTLISAKVRRTAIRECDNLIHRYPSARVVRNERRTWQYGPLAVCWDVVIDIAPADARAATPAEEARP